MSSLNGAPRVTVWKNDLTFVFPSGFGTLAAKDIWYRQVMDTMEVKGFITAGTVVGTEANIQIPTYTIDTAKLPAGYQIVGEWARIVSGSIQDLYDSNFAGPLFYDGSTNNKLYFAQKSLSSTFQKANASGFAVNGDGVSFKFSVPIVGWGLY